jgi:hypothetical protein
MKKALLVTGATTIVGLASFAGVANAATSSGSTGSDSLVDKIATKFNLNKSDVQAVFDENRTEHEAERQQKLEERLSQAVTDGKITSDQKDEILAKLKDMQTYMDSIKDKSADERHSLMKTKMDEMKQWAEDNGLSDYMPMGRGPGGPGGHGGDMAPPDDGGTSSSSSDSSSSSTSD